MFERVVTSGTTLDGMQCALDRQKTALRPLSFDVFDVTLFLFQGVTDCGDILSLSRRSFRMANAGNEAQP